MATVPDEWLEPSGKVLRQSLTGLATRQQLIANNLANVDTPGYRGYDIAFERALQQEMNRQGDLALLVTSPGHMRSPASPMERATIQRQPPHRSDGNSVDVDVEMAKLAETTIGYNVTAQLLSARLSLLRSAVTEGRR